MPGQKEKLKRYLKAAELRPAAVHENFERTPARQASGDEEWI